MRFARRGLAASNPAKKNHSALHEHPRKNGKIVQTVTAHPAMSTSIQNPSAQNNGQRCMASPSPLMRNPPMQLQHNLLRLPHLLDATCFGCHRKDCQRSPPMSTTKASRRATTQLQFPGLRDTFTSTASTPRHRPSHRPAAPVRILVSSQNANREWLYYSSKQSPPRLVRHLLTSSPYVPQETSSALTATLEKNTTTLDAQLLCRAPTL